MQLKPDYKKPREIFQAEIPDRTLARISLEDAVLGALEKIADQQVQGEQAATSADQVVIEEIELPEHREPAKSRVTLAQPFFIDDRITQGKQHGGIIPSSKNGNYDYDDFMQLIRAELAGIDQDAQSAANILNGQPAQVHGNDTWISAVSRAGVSTSDGIKEYRVSKQAQNAFMRAMNFVDYLAGRMSGKDQEDFLKKKADMNGPPRHMPDEQFVEKFERFSSYMGYSGSLVWYLPEIITLEDLLHAGVLLPDWWMDEPNFVKGHTLRRPHSIDKCPNERDTGYWMMALPGIMPFTANRSYLEQEDMMLEVARSVGLSVDERGLDPDNFIRPMIRPTVDTCVFFAMAQHNETMLSSDLCAVRTSTFLRACRYDGIPEGRNEVKPGDRSLYDCHIVVEFNGDGLLRLREMGDNARTIYCGLAPFFVPFIY